MPADFDNIVRLSNTRALVIQIKRLSRELDVLSSGFPDDLEYLRSPNHLNQLRYAATGLNNDYNQAFNNELKKLQGDCHDTT